MKFVGETNQLVHPEKPLCKQKINLDVSESCIMTLRIWSGSGNGQKHSRPLHNKGAAFNPGAAHFIHICGVMNGWLVQFGNTEPSGRRFNPLNRGNGIKSRNHRNPPSGTERFQHWQGNRSPPSPANGFCHQED